MAKNTRNMLSIDPLSLRHEDQVRSRKRADNMQLRHTWAVAFRLTAGSSPIRPLGSTAMLVMFSQPSEDPRERDSQVVLGLRAKPQVDTAKVVWAVPDQDHDFNLPVRRVAVRGGMSLQNDTWVSLALEADAEREMLMSGYMLDAVPQMPQIWVGYHNPAAAPFCDTPELRLRVAGHMGKSFEELEQMDPIARSLLLRAEWPSLFLPPKAGGNTTDQYLIDNSFVRSLRGSSTLFEDFTDLLGQIVHNPWDDLRTYQIQNPAAGIAAENGWNLEATLSRVGGQIGSDDERALDDKHLDLLPSQIRQYLGPLAAVVDATEIDQAVTEPRRCVPVLAEKLAGLSDADAVRCMRALLRQLSPHVLDGVTDAELLAARANPEQQMVIGKLPRIQVLANPHANARHPSDRLPYLYYTSQSLGRTGLTLDLHSRKWHEENARISETADTGTPVLEPAGV